MTQARRNKIARRRRLEAAKTSEGRVYVSQVDVPRDRTTETPGRRTERKLARAAKVAEVENATRLDEENSRLPVILKGLAGKRVAYVREPSVTKYDDNIRPLSGALEYGILRPVNNRQRRMGAVAVLEVAAQDAFGRNKTVSVTSRLIVIELFPATAGMKERGIMALGKSGSGRLWPVLFLAPE